jgi:hypothetical protein
MAQPVIVTAVTTESGAALGPVEDHGTRPYSRRAGGVKIVRLQIRSERGRASRFGSLDGDFIAGTKPLQFYETFRFDRLSSINQMDSR